MCAAAGGSVRRAIRGIQRRIGSSGIHGGQSINQSLKESGHNQKEAKQKGVPELHRGVCFMILPGFSGERFNRRPLLTPCLIISNQQAADAIGRMSLNPWLNGVAWRPPCSAPVHMVLAFLMLSAGGRASRVFVVLLRRGAYMHTCT